MKILHEKYVSFNGLMGFLADQKPTFSEYCVITSQTSQSIETFSFFTHSFNLVIFAVDYAIPMVLMSVTYYRIGRVFWGSQAIGELTEGQREAIRGRQRVVTMLITVTVLFAICWLPYHIYFIYIKYDPNIITHKYISNIYLTIYWLAMSNSAINPVIYAILSKR